jgi:hypothetical protein
MGTSTEDATAPTLSNVPTVYRVPNSDELIYPFRCVISPA